MTTTACDDQFAPEPVAPVRERYDTAAILRRNVANLEIALKQQTDRAEAAEAELEAVREDNHAMMLEIDGMRTERAIQAERDFESLISDDNTIQEYAYELGGTDSGEYHLTAQDVARIAAKASEPYTSALRSLASYVGAGGYNADAVDAGVFEDKIRWGIGEIIARMEKVAPDCQTCANRGLVNGLSQESYCDGCVYQGRSWRQNHFVLAVKRRCEACAILPCSCK